MSKRPRIPRRRHVPGTFRPFERKGPDPKAEEQRIVLYLPIAALDRAERQAMLAGVESVQRYCEALLMRAIEAQDTLDRDQSDQSRRGRLDRLLAIADDPDYLVEWTASLRRPPGGGTPSPIARVPGDGDSDRDGEAEAEAGRPSPEAIVERPAAEVIFHHAGLLGDSPGGFLTLLRAGAPIPAEIGRELMRALVDLEVEHRGASLLDRGLSYALHKLAFEGQVLATEAGVSVDEETVDLLRLVQEGVDRVLSGQDIRYYSSS
ncbi:hypothetical protein [Tautonia sociabilis]|uniref:Uncharacterized protein n=1 Tax=Tautonia sociabilis TaxID=2080755 RepID=A0A432MQC1_9BACT|nr:hypothetical protein [Tautonia sociabilis]RUL89693.1 hypothetical protein TsocGM_00550 [Tautonia sociabilis]